MSTPAYERVLAVYESNSRYLSPEECEIMAGRFLERAELLRKQSIKRRISSKPIIEMTKYEK
ncbi:MAG: hypothetical protein ACI4I1_01285 [Oscillospiraceae bacterium]